MDKIIIKDLLVRGIIGINDWEREKAQDILINIEIQTDLAKAGGIGPALRQIRLARELGLKVMLGCMVESSVGVAAAAMVASEVDWLDLDGNLLLADGPFEGLRLGPDCRWQLPREPGLGVWRKA